MIIFICDVFNVNRQRKYLFQKEKLLLVIRHNLFSLDISGFLNSFYVRFYFLVFHSSIFRLVDSSF